ncbi:hypothetical protein IEQ34_014614 [Dendrobium chrysotoxum]|uniref:O-methyltransferase dimerisation domain-containing protein n=1 Tax=Dendrobium chrysotoxum TaxID=161865 RepID=A0AAV7GMD7_DENCH|nr:hypothetical protein IEQ34_014614 [Dendrobium chrysotoxum]
MGSYNPTADGSTGDEAAYLYAMQLTSFFAFPMTLKVVIELKLLEAISLVGPGAQHSPSKHIYCLLFISNPQAPVMLERILRLLACYSILTCALSAHLTEKLFCSDTGRIRTSGMLGILVVPSGIDRDSVSARYQLRIRRGAFLLESECVWCPHRIIFPSGERRYGAAHACKFLTPNADGASMAALYLMTQDGELVLSQGYGDRRWYFV